MNTIFYLKTCDTCKRILKTIPNLEDFALREIKSEPITSEELDKIHIQTNSYELLFNKRAQLYKERNLKELSLSEDDYRNLILEHYTFLARPIIRFQDKYYIGTANLY